MKYVTDDVAKGAISWFRAMLEKKGHGPKPDGYEDKLNKAFQILRECQKAYETKYPLECDGVEKGKLTPKINN